MSSLAYILQSEASYEISTMFFLIPFSSLIQTGKNLLGSLSVIVTRTSPNKIVMMNLLQRCFQGTTSTLLHKNNYLHSGSLSAVIG